MFTSIMKNPQNSLQKRIVDLKNCKIWIRQIHHLQSRKMVIAGVSEDRKCLKVSTLDSSDYLTDQIFLESHNYTNPHRLQ